VRRHQLTPIVLWVAFAARGAPAGEPAAAVGFLEVKEQGPGQASLPALLEEAGAAEVRDLTAALREGEAPLQDPRLSVLVAGSFVTGDARIRTLFDQRGEALRAFVERGGVLLVLSQSGQDLPEESWLPPEVMVTHGVRDYARVRIIEPGHPLLAIPRPLDAESLAVWKSRHLSLETMAFAGGAWTLAAQDEAGREPWLVDAGWGAGRVVFLSWALDRLEPEERPEERALAVRFLGNFLAFAASVAGKRAPPPPSRAPRVAAGTVFRDLNGDGRRDPQEPGIAGVGVSDGLQVTLTGPDGRYRLEVAPEVVPEVFITIPAGYRKTHRFFRKVPAGPGEAVLDFGLRPLEPGEAETSFAQVSDVHVGGGKPVNDLLGLRAAFREIADLPDRPAFILGTGDLTDGSSREEFAELLAGMEESRVPFIPVIGNHDCGLLAGGGRRNWREFLGPDYYSLDAGRYHLVLLNTIRRPHRQRKWVKRDLRLLGRGRPVIVAAHYPPTLEELSEYAGWGAVAMASGHWHSNKVNAVNGVLSVNTPTFLMGGIDLSPGGFRLWRLAGDRIRTECRMGGVDRLFQIVQPGGGILPGDGGDIIANLYATSDRIDRVRFRLSREGREISAGALEAEGPMTWRGKVPRTPPPGPPPPASANSTDGVEIEVAARTARGAEWRESRRVSGQPAPAVVKTGEDWPCFMGGAARRGEATALRPPFRLAWCAYTGGPVHFASPIVAAGRVFISMLDLDGGGGVLALDAASGREAWRFPTADQTWHSAAFADGKVVVVEETGGVHALDALTGREIWRRDLRDPSDTDTRWLKSAPAIAEGTVYAGNNARTAAIGLADGEVRWRKSYATDWITGYGSPAVSGRRVVIPGLWSRPPLCADAATGEVLWTAAKKKEDEFTIQGSPLIDGDLVVFARTDAQVSAHRLETGDLQWKTPVPENWIPSTPAAARGSIVVGSGSGEVRALERESGKVRWEFKTGPSPVRIVSYRSDFPGLTSSPTIAGDVVYIGGADGRLYALELEGGAMIWSHAFGAPVLAAPAVSGNTLFAATLDGHVYALAGEPSQR
jgi:outer membrane protein assembly factor BamB